MMAKPEMSAHGLSLTLLFLGLAVSGCSSATRCADLSYYKDQQACETKSRIIASQVPGWTNPHIHPLRPQGEPLDEQEFNAIWSGTATLQAGQAANNAANAAANAAQAAANAAAAAAAASAAAASMTAPAGF